VQTADVRKHFFKLLWEAFTEGGYLDGELLLHDLVVLLLLALSLHRLPRQTALSEVDQHVDQRLQVVPTALLDAQMRVDRSVPGSACEVLVVAVGNVLSLLTKETLGQSKVDHEDLGNVLPASDEEIVRLKVAVQHSSRVDEADELEHFQSDEQRGFEGEAAFAEVEEVFEGVSQ
jgi:hypothetical protein